MTRPPAAVVAAGSAHKVATHGSIALTPRPAWSEMARKITEALDAA
jgi:hypothetical protein